MPSYINMLICTSYVLYIIYRLNLQHFKHTPIYIYLYIYIDLCSYYMCTHICIKVVL